MSPTPALVAETFTQIAQQRMQDFPLSNPALTVEIVAFQQWQERWLGVLITPWCMNLLLLPNAADDWSSLKAGSEQVHQLPSGDYSFLVAHEELLGSYQMCSLFSPMQDFSDQDTANATALMIMEQLLAPAPAAQTTSAPVTTAAPAPESVQLSRRHFLRGAFFKRD